MSRSTTPLRSSRPMVWNPGPSYYWLDHTVPKSLYLQMIYSVIINYHHNMLWIDLSSIIILNHIETSYAIVHFIEWYWLLPCALFFFGDDHRDATCGNPWDLPQPGSAAYQEGWRWSNRHAVPQWFFQTKGSKGAQKKRQDTSEMMYDVCICLCMCLCLCIYILSIYEFVYVSM